MQKKTFFFNLKPERKSFLIDHKIVRKNRAGEGAGVFRDLTVAYRKGGEVNLISYYLLNKAI